MQSSTDLPGLGAASPSSSPVRVLADAALTTMRLEFFAAVATEKANRIRRMKDDKNPIPAKKQAVSQGDNPFNDLRGRIDLREKELVVAQGNNARPLSVQDSLVQTIHIRELAELKTVHMKERAELFKIVRELTYTAQQSDHTAMCYLRSNKSLRAAVKLCTNEVYDLHLENISLWGLFTPGMFLDLSAEEMSKIVDPINLKLVRAVKMGDKVMEQALVTARRMVDEKKVVLVDNLALKKENEHLRTNFFARNWTKKMNGLLAHASTAMNAAIEEKDAAIKEKDAATQEKDTAMTAIKEKDAAIRQKDAALEKKVLTIKKHEARDHHREGSVKARDTFITGLQKELSVAMATIKEDGIKIEQQRIQISARDATIARLYGQLAEMKLAQ
jgi:hypothetical protein